MLSELQRQKLTHYFHVLDQDRNAVLDRNDFVEIGEALCILWRFKPGTAEYDRVMARCTRGWDLFEESFKTHGGIANLEQFLKFAEKMISPEGRHIYDQYVTLVVSEMFDSFDLNQDGVISINEYVDMFMAYHIAIKYSAKAFLKIDRDGNDEITKEELLEAVDEFFMSNDEKAPGNWLFGFWAEKD
jgi:Ca2+-binding EF-hand superfamily protein